MAVVGGGANPPGSPGLRARRLQRFDGIGLGPDPPAAVPLVPADLQVQLMIAASRLESERAHRLSCEVTRRAAGEVGVY